MGLAWRWPLCATSWGFELNIDVRPIQTGDVPDACRILNEIIAIGGTTAFEIEVSEAAFAQMYVHGKELIACHTAIDPAGRVVGFQWIGLNGALPPNCVDIATFTRRDPPLLGAGRSLFAVTRDFARNAGFTQINATIRADNVPGLGYYAKMGFKDHSLTKGVPLRDGTPVDRISRRYAL